MNPMDFIKVEQESPLYSNSKEMNFFATHFYDIQSQYEVKHEDQFTLQSTQQILEHLESLVDLRTTSIEEILDLARKDQVICQQIQWSQLRKKILKRKMFLKRYFARKRDRTVNFKKNIYIFGNADIVKDEVQEIQEETKKKRNRMSAQISRDRKKIQIHELQVFNYHLREQSQRITEENQKLKRQLANFNKFQEESVATESKVHKSKFLSLLIMMGILFLVSFFKESPAKSQDILAPKRMENTRKECQSYEEDIVSGSQKAFMELQRSGSPLITDKRQMKSIMGYLERMKEEVRGVHLPEGLKRQLDSIRANLF